MELYLNRGINKIDTSRVFSSDELQRFQQLGEAVQSLDTDPGIVVYNPTFRKTPDKRTYATFESQSTKEHAGLALHRPLYTNIGEGDEINLEPARYIHTIQLNPTKIMLYARAWENGDITGNEEYMAQILAQSSALLLNGASIADVTRYARQIRPQQTFAWTPPQEAYHLSAEDFYRNTSQDIFPAMEIHDVVVHPTQFRVWPDFFHPLNDLAVYARSVLPRGHRFSRFLDYSFFASAEYGVAGETIEKAAPLGCLIYTYPRKNPMRWTDITELEAPEKLLTKWEALRASASLFRRHDIHKRRLSDDIDWYQAFGYVLPQELQPVFDEELKRYKEPTGEITDPKEPIDMSNVKYPTSEEELMAYVLKQLRVEFSMLDAVSSAERKTISDKIDSIKV